MAPQYEKAAKDRPQYKFGKVDIDQEPELAARYQIVSIPTVTVFNAGHYIGSNPGAVGARQLLQVLDQLSGLDRT